MSHIASNPDSPGDDDDYKKVTWTSEGLDGDLQDPLKRWDYVGRCYDILRLDPLNLGGSALSHMAFAFQADDFVNTPDKTASHPSATDYTPGSGGSLAKSSSTMSTVYDFKRYFASAIAVEASDPTGEVFNASLSTSVASTQNELSSHEKAINFSDERIVVYKLALSDDMTEFTLDDDLMTALLMLPEQGEPNDPAFADFFKRFGTHYSVSATLGGRARVRRSRTSSRAPSRTAARACNTRVARLRSTSTCGRCTWKPIRHRSSSPWLRSTNCLTSTCSSTWTSRS